MTPLFTSFLSFFLPSLLFPHFPSSLFPYFFFFFLQSKFPVFSNEHLKLKGENVLQLHLDIHRYQDTQVSEIPKLPNMNSIQMLRPNSANPVRVCPSLVPWKWMPAEKRSRCPSLFSCQSLTPTLLRTISWQARILTPSLGPAFDPTDRLPLSPGEEERSSESNHGAETAASA